MTILKRANMKIVILESKILNEIFMNRETLKQNNCGKENSEKDSSEI